MKSKALYNNMTFKTTRERERERERERVFFYIGSSKENDSYSIGCFYSISFFVGLLYADSFIFEDINQDETRLIF